MKSLINRITKWWNDTEIDSFSVVTAIVFIGVIILFALNITETEKLPSKDGICQKHFGKDYVWHEGYRGADFCVGDSGIPKYPKSWKE
nr:MAG TPA: hypothetical protein [Caudoviricetes sp.]